MSAVKIPSSSGIGSITKSFSSEGSVTTRPWLASAWQSIVDRVNNDALPHALLLHAPEGFGKHIIAYELAKFLLCQGDEKTNQGCGQCPSCVWFHGQENSTKQCHPDCYPIASDADSGVVKIDDIRYLISQVGQTANQAGWKIGIIFKAHRLNNQAFNAFLKTLEEPTDKTLFLLLADNLSTLPLTILSRVQRLSFSLADGHDRDKAMQWLSASGKYKQAEVERALWLAMDAPLRASEFLHNKTIDQYQQWLTNMDDLQNGKLGSVEMAKKWQAIKELNIVWLCGLIHQKLCQPKILENISHYRQWLVYEQALKKNQHAWLQNLNDLSVLQTTYAEWQNCYRPEE